MRHEGAGRISGPPNSHGGKTHVSDDSGMTHPPRILVVSREQWPRALLRAQLGEAGYDAIGTGTLSRALRHAPDDAERGPLRVVVVDVEPRAPRLRRSSTRFRQRLLASDASVRDGSGKQVSKIENVDEREVYTIKLQ